MKFQSLATILISLALVSCSTSKPYYAYVENSEVCEIDHNFEEKCIVIEEIDGLDFHRQDYMDYLSMPKPSRKNY